MATAVYAGTFDPVTYGHLDIIKRAGQVFDRLIIATTESHSKNPMFSLAERMDLLRQSVDEIDGNIQVESFTGLLVDFARRKEASVLVRGLRAAGDFDYEFQMAMMNRALAPEIETSFFVTNPSYMFVSSSLIREIAAAGGPLDEFVTPLVRDAIISRLG
ncbi:pantetheine-phosphate adenylyltransferase [bacterium]|nr:pantetheine-phosphate adenylyltransferase [bacterium]MCB1219865.1 pantetheine-phosphate adenylyltransferase [bacterium]UNM07169.1 MAG: pantetheine-phosphate adenylyltransferase [Planctomycetales bacterium]